MFDYDDYIDQQVCESDGNYNYVANEPFNLTFYASSKFISVYTPKHMCKGQLIRTPLLNTEAVDTVVIKHDAVIVSAVYFN